MRIRSNAKNFLANEKSFAFCIWDASQLHLDLDGSISSFGILRTSLKVRFSTLVTSNGVVPRLNVFAWYLRFPLQQGTSIKLQKMKINSHNFNQTCDIINSYESVTFHTLTITYRFFINTNIITLKFTIISHWNIHIPGQVCFAVSRLMRWASVRFEPWTLWFEGRYHTHCTNEATVIVLSHVTKLLNSPKGQRYALCLVVNVFIANIHAYDVECSILQISTKT